MNDNRAATAAQICARTPSLRPDATLHDAMPLLHEHNMTGDPGVADNVLVVGWLDHRDVLATYARLHTSHDTIRT